MKTDWLYVSKTSGSHHAHMLMYRPKRQARQTINSIGNGMNQFFAFEILALGRKFIFHDLDETHLFISPDIVEVLQAKFDDMMDQISFPLHEKTN
ncbi:hypothetical protein HA402_000037 [Bradysia odoriphaga]|nr:hypothetical protein HA402_000037 [Bradysia odoriphaga]